MKKLELDHITLGVCYYPEHWDCSLWRDDLRHMKSLGIEVIRIAEFAWNKFEPHDGVFTYDFFDKFMDIAVEEGIKVIFCTPTATPPAWLSEKYPEILNADENGNLIRHGMRRHYNMNSPVYLRYAARITEKIAEHYSHYENIVMWQLDNEINCECDLYFSDSDHIAFRQYLKEKFGTLDALNEAIGATFWNQTYSDWDEVFLPRRNYYGHHSNPHMCLLQKHFISDTVIKFFKLEADIIRRYSKAPITTNGLFGFIDYQKLVGEVLDFITYDNYPNFAFDKNNDPAWGTGMRDRNTSYNLTRARGISPVFGIMEQQSGPSGWNFRMTQPAPKPGQVRLWTMQGIAHGVDYISYFRWRTCTFGTEIYWHGLLDYCNRPNRRTAEISDIYKDIQKIQSVCGKEYVAEAALLRDYDTEWDAAEDVWHSEADGISYDGWFRAFQKKHIPYDLVYVDDDTALEELKKYKLCVYPHPTILTEKRAALLKAYAEQGGTVIFGCRTGYKDEFGRCKMTPMPCEAAPLCGAEVEEFTFLSPYDKMQTVSIGGKQVAVPCFNDVLRLTDGESVGTFDSNYYEGKCAASVKSIGNGKVYYFGAPFIEEAARAFIDMEGLSSPMGIDRSIDLPEDIELAIRGDKIFLINYGEKPVSFSCSKAYKDLLTDTVFDGSITVGRFGVVVLDEI